MIAPTAVMEHGCIESYLKTIARMNVASAKVYGQRLNNFNDFCKGDTDETINKIKNGALDPYKLLNVYIEYLQHNHTLSPSTLKQNVITCKNCMEYHDVEISNVKFKLKVKFPKTIRKSKQALSKDDVCFIINSCSEIRLKTYVMLLASTGMRAVEALSCRLKDFKARKILLRGEVTKTRTERTVWLTEECSKQIEALIEYKYRTRRVCYYNARKHLAVNEYRTPPKNENDLIFAVRQTKPNPKNIYNHLSADFGKTLARIDMNTKEEYVSNPNSRLIHKERRRITLHSFRRFVKSTISDLGFGDFSEYIIGHKGSTYYTKTDKQIEEIFNKIAPHLTFLDYPSLTRQGSDVQAKIDVLEQENARLRQTEEASKNELTVLSEQMSRLGEEMKGLREIRQYFITNGFSRVVKEMREQNPELDERFVRNKSRT
jgi:integrase